MARKFPLALAAVLVAGVAHADPLDVKKVQAAVVERCSEQHSEINCRVYCIRLQLEHAEAARAILGDGGSRQVTELRACISRSGGDLQETGDDDADWSGADWQEAMHCYVLALLTPPF